MNAINKILADYYWIFLISGITILVFLIRFLIVNRKKTGVQENIKNDNEVSNVNKKEEPHQMIPMVPNASNQSYGEPTLDLIASGANQVNLGFDSNFSLDANNSNASVNDSEFSLIIEDPLAKKDDVNLVIEDPNLVQNNVDPSQLSIFELTPGNESIVSEISPVSVAEQVQVVNNSNVQTVASIPEMIESVDLNSTVVNSQVPVNQYVNTVTNSVVSNVPQTPVSDVVETLDL